MKKIAIFQENLTVGGIQKSLINLLNNLDYSKVSVDCYVVNDVNFYTEGISKKVKLKNNSKKTKKVGRNDMCSCGSGKKI